MILLFQPRMDQYFNQMEKIVKERKTSSRIRFMLQDVIDLRLVSRKISLPLSSLFHKLAMRNVLVITCIITFFFFRTIHAARGNSPARG